MYTSWPLRSFPYLLPDIKYLVPLKLTTGQIEDFYMKSLINTFSALADLNRIKIIAALILNNELLSAQIIEFLNQSQQTVSEHLVILIKAGLIKKIKIDNTSVYKLNKDSRDFETIAQLIKNRMDSDPDFQQELNRIDEILAQ